MKDLSLPFNQSTFLTAHNSFANREDGWAYYQQKYDVDYQLAFGVRGFMIDLWLDTIDGVEDIYLLHGGWKLKWLFPYFKFRTLDDFFDKISDFLNQPCNLHEIVTVFFETGSTTKSDKGVKMVKHIMKKYKHMMYDPASGSGFNITLEKMIETGKRLVVLSDYRGGDTHSTNPHDEFGLPLVWHYCYENVYGNESLEPYKWVDERPESDDSNSEVRSLGLMNHFPNLGPVTFFAMNIDSPVAGLNELIMYFEDVNDSMTLENHVIDYQMAYGFPPNFVAIDMVSVGTGPKHICRYCDDALNLTDYEVSIQGVNDYFMKISDDPAVDNALIYCKKQGVKLVFELFGTLRHCVLRLRKPVSDRDLFLSYRAITGAVKLFRNPANFKLKHTGYQSYEILSLDAEEDMWLSGEEPYITRTGKKKLVLNKWYLEINGKLPPKKEIKIKSKLNGRFMAVKSVVDNELIYCDSGQALTFQIIGPLHNCVLRLRSHHNLYLSYRGLTGAVKLYSSPDQANFCIEEVNEGVYTIKSICYDYYMWLSDTSPYITRNAASNQTKAHWTIHVV